MHKVVGLLKKDFRLHWLSTIGSWTGLALFLGILTWKIPPRNLDEELALVLKGNFLLNVIYSELLIYREKTKGTYSWLRSMPLSESHIVTSKFFAFGIMQSLGYVITTALIAPEGLMPAYLGSFLLNLCAMLAFGALMLCTRSIFNQRFGLAVPFLIVFIVLLSYMQATQSYPDFAAWLIDLWPSLGFKVTVGLLLSTWVFLMWLLMVRWISSKDTTDLTE